MASKQKYVCFVCQKNGFDNVQVFLDGKDEKGHTKYLESDGVTKHVHQQQPQQQEVTRRSQSLQTDEPEDTSNTNALLKIIIAELQRLIKLFEEQQKQSDNVSSDRNLLDNR